MTAPYKVDQIIMALRSQGVTRDVVDMVIEEFEANELELQELREARLNLTVLAEQLRAQDDTLNDERIQMLDQLEVLQAKLGQRDLPTKFRHDDEEVSPDALKILRYFGRNPEQSQTFTSLRQNIVITEASLLESVNELGLRRLLNLGTDMGHPDEFYLSPRGREYLLKRLQRRGLE